MGWLDKLLGREERDRGWYTDPNPKRVRVYVDNEDNCVLDECIRDRFWHRDISVFFYADYWMHTAESQARSFADEVRKKGLTTSKVAYPAHRIHKVVIVDVPDLDGGDGD